MCVDVDIRDIVLLVPPVSASTSVFTNYITSRLRSKGNFTELTLLNLIRFESIAGQFLNGLIQN